MSDFDRKVRVVATAWDTLANEPEWADVLKHYDLGFPYAWLVYTDMGTLNEQGMEQVQAVYDFLLKAMKIEDSEDYYVFWDLVTAQKAG